MNIYWIQDKQRRGPATAPDVITLVQMGEISADTLGWHAGCKGWMPLRELPALADFLNELHETSKGQEAAEQAPLPETEETKPAHPERTEGAAPAPEPMQDQQSQNANRLYMPSPSIRLIARLVDCSIYSTIVMGVLYALKAPYFELYLPSCPLFWIPMVLLETFCLCRWNATPGKALLGITVRPFGPRDNLLFGQALIRSVYVFIGGVGLYIPYLSVAMMLLSYFVLKRKRICFWDLRMFTMPVRKGPQRPERVIIGIICIFMCAQLTSAFIRPWLPDMVQVIEQNSPETAGLLRNMLPASDLPDAPAKESVIQPLSRP